MSSESHVEVPRTDILDKLAADGHTRFETILLFNSFITTSSGHSGIESLCEYHSNLMALHEFMAGFQYVVVNSEVSSEDLSALQQAAVAMQTIGFGMSLGGTFVSLLAMEYLKGVLEEPPELQVEGIFKNIFFFKLSDLSGTAAALVLYVTTTCYYMNSFLCGYGLLYMYSHCCLALRFFTSSRLPLWTNIDMEVVDVCINITLGTKSHVECGPGGLVEVRK
jgi:hypothetical protein